MLNKHVNKKRREYRQGPRYNDKQATRMKKSGTIPPRPSGTPVGCVMQRSNEAMRDKEMTMNGVGEYKENECVQEEQVGSQVQRLIGMQEW